MPVRVKVVGVGLTVGLTVGETVGETVGGVGVTVGETVGDTVGETVGGVGVTVGVPPQYCLNNWQNTSLMFVHNSSNLKFHSLQCLVVSRKLER